MKYVRTEGCHVGLFREFVGTACCTYGLSTTTVNNHIPVEISHQIADSQATTLVVGSENTEKTTEVQRQIPSLKVIRCYIWGNENDYDINMYIVLYQPQPYIYISLYMYIWNIYRPKYQNPVHLSTSSGPCNGPLTRYVKLRVAHAPGMPGTFPPPPRVIDPDMHHGTCVTRNARAVMHAGLVN